MTTNGVTNPVAPAIKITLDRERTIIMDLNALAAIEDQIGKSALNPETWTAEIDARMLRAFLWAGLLRDDPDLKIEQVGAMLHPGNYQEVFAKVQESVATAMPDGEPDADPLPGTSPGPVPPQTG